MATYRALARAEFAYEATDADELSVAEDQVLWVVDDSDPECVTTSSPRVPARARALT